MDGSDPAKRSIYVALCRSDSMQDLLKNGHDISEKFYTDNGAAIPPT